LTRRVARTRRIEMKTLRKTLGLACAWTVGVVTIALLAASAQASERGDTQFSPGGAYAARYLDSASTIRTWSFATWPKGEVVSKAITVAAPWVSDDKSIWRVLDDGSVWIADGTTLTRYADGADTPQTIDIGSLLPPSLKLEMVLMSSGRTASILYVESKGDTVFEIRCALAEDLVTAGGPGRSCKAAKTFSPGRNEPYTDAGSRSYPLQYLSIYPNNYADYSASALYRWLRTSNYTITSNTKIRIERYYKDGAEILRDESQSESNSNPDVLSTRWANYGGYTIYESSSTETILSRADDKSVRISLSGTDVLISYDGRYAFTRKPGTSGSSYLVRDLAKPAGTEREVLMPVNAGILLSPDNRFFVQESFLKPQPIAFLTDPYFGKSEEVVVDLLMARIVKMLGESRWDDALPAFAELEGRGGDLPEDFYFYQADTLAQAGHKAEAQKKADVFVSKYGRKSKHYGRMIEILAQ
jgi:hypothetical protein